MNLRIYLFIIVVLLFTSVLHGQNRGLQSMTEALSGNGKRIALVIGNANYEHAGELKNPINDAELIETTLKKIGFEVFIIKNATKKELKDGLDRFAIKVLDGRYEVALYYYSGHGLEVNGYNYIMPIDANPNSSADVELECFAANSILKKLEEAGATTKIIILDACRNNPLTRSWGRNPRNGGLSAMEAPKGTFIGFSTSPKSVALDGVWANSPYTSALAEFIPQDGLEIGQVFNRVSKVTQTKAAKEGQIQIPFISSSLDNDFFFTTSGTTRIISGPGSVGIKDQDFDEVPDDQDDCPEQYGTLRGCPDSDVDGVADQLDQCPFEAGGSDWGGCPKVDEDLDGVVDAADKCPLVFGLKIWQGCPDSDGDGIPDHLDLCPSIAGIGEKEGCPAESYVDQLIGRMMFVEGGVFTMGCTKEQKNCEDREKPKHKVQLSSYYIGETEITRAQWFAVMGKDTSSRIVLDCEECPVAQLTWEDAQRFVRQLNSISKLGGYRLPTEAEWEFAARGGVKGKSFSFSGSNNLDAVAWFSNNSANRAHPVKSKAPNLLGIYDMSGNVWEWCSDLFSDYAVKETQQYTREKKEGAERVCRGGSWAYEAYACRVAYRATLPQNQRGNSCGLRLARTY